MAVLPAAERLICDRCSETVFLEPGNTPNSPSDWYHLRYAPRFGLGNESTKTLDLCFVCARALTTFLSEVQ